MFNPLQTARPEGLTTPLYSLGAKLFVVCAGPGEVSNLCCERRHCSLYHLLVDPRSPTGDKPWYLRQGKFAAMLHHYLPLGVTNEERIINSRAIKQISGAVAGDSTLQDRGVEHYLLPLLFSLVSLLSSFCFRVLYQKPQKN